MKIKLSWNTVPRLLAISADFSERTVVSILTTGTLKIKSANSSETYVTISKSTERLIPQDLDLPFKVLS
jgi:hypothetical protein